jgi:recA bacterial DNA recombination protein
VSSARALELVGDPEIAARIVPLARLSEKRGHRPTGVAALDALLGGGWPRGALSELCGARSSGRTAIVRAALAAALDAGEAAALVDAGGTLDARAVPRDRRQTAAAPLWIRCAAEQALKAADLVIAAGGFGLVALDLCDATLRVPDAAWMRLRHAARAQGTTVLVTTGRARLGSFAAAAVELDGAAAFLGDGPPLFSRLDVRARCRRADPSPDQPRPPCVSLAFTCRS